MKYTLLRVVWSLKMGFQSVHIPNTSFSLYRKNVRIRTYRTFQRPFVKRYKVRVHYHGEIIQNPVWNDSLVFKIVMAGKRMYKTLRTNTMIEGIQVCFEYVD
jgi:hypothetical protein